jgi:hypothetical protein
VKPREEKKVGQKEGVLFLETLKKMQNRTDWGKYLMPVKYEKNK